MSSRPRADEIFREVCDLPAAHQRAAVEERCGNDSALREEVLTLLAADEAWSDVEPRSSGAADRYRLLEAVLGDADPSREPALESVGPYVVTRLLGRGGMGVVYEARDTRLDRHVALKVLPERLLRDPERRARLEREAKVLASLNHPNIASIYGIEEAGERRVLVLELVRGEDLSERLARGPLPLEEALEMAAQVAEGLSAAHDAGVIHRDLKPTNIKLGRAGEVKILDFGIAKRVQAEAVEAAGDDTTSPATEGTEPGTVIGTVSYMSPEQARGRTVDRRADLWSFGCVLYEALGGRRAFDGETASDVLAAVLERDPDWQDLPADTPPAIRRLLRRCLEKSPNRRLRDAGDARLEISEYLEGRETSDGGAAPVARPRSRVTSLLAVFLAACVGAAASAVAVSALLHRGVDGEPVAQVRRLSVVLPEGTELAFSGERGMGRPSIALSADGRRLAWVARTGEGVRLFLRELDAPEARALPGTEGAYNPFFSPDGNWIAFFADGALKKVSTLGGRPVFLCAALHPRGGSWGSDETIVFAGYGGDSLWRVSAKGGEPERIVRGESGWTWPSFLPQGQTVLVSGFADVRARDLESGEEELLIDERSTGVSYVPTGHLVFTRGGVLMAAPFDLEELRITGAVTPVMEGIRVEARGAAQYAVSRDGTLAYVPGRLMEEGRLVWLDREEGARPVEAWPGYRKYGMFRLSPDGEKLAVCLLEPTSHISIYDKEGREDRLTYQGHESWPIWLDDELVLYSARRDDVEGLFSRRADGRGVEELIAEGSMAPYGVSRGDRVVLVTRGGDVSAVHLSTGELKSVVATPFFDWGGSFSPDGKWIAYTREAAGTPEVHIRSYLDPGIDRKISVDGGEEPIWSPKGDEVFYRNDDRWMAVRVTREPELQVGAAQLLFTGDYLNIPGMSYDYDPHQDRFLLIEPRKEAPAREIRLVLEWFEELRLERLMPPGAERTVRGTTP